MDNKKCRCHQVFFSKLTIWSHYIGTSKVLEHRGCTHFGEHNRWLTVLILFSEPKREQWKWYFFVCEPAGMIMASDIKQSNQGCLLTMWSNCGFVIASIVGAIWWFFLQLKAKNSICFRATWLHSIRVQLPSIKPSNSIAKPAWFPDPITKKW